MEQTAKERLRRRVWAALLALAWVVGLGPGTVRGAGSSEPRVVTGQVFRGGLEAGARAERAVPRRLDPARPVGRQLTLAPLADRLRLAASEPARALGAPLRVGRHRRLPSALAAEIGAHDLEWEAARDGGEVAVFSVTSPGAKALRVALDLRRLPPGSELRFYSPSEPLAAGGPFDAKVLGSGRGSPAADPFWSPVVAGETMVVEVWVPGWPPAADLRLSVRKVSHLYRSLAPEDLRHLDGASECSRDLRCFKKWTMAGNAVAKVIIEKDGGTRLCTGQLIANPRGKPLLLTAAHCVGRRSEANSTSFFWFFERAACNGDDPTTVTQTGGGARLLFSSRSNSEGLVTDHTLMALRVEPPAGVTMLPWTVDDDAADNLRRRVHSAHHAQGGVKKMSRGKVTEIWQLQPNRTVLDLDPPTHYQVNWKTGVTEGGSSGAALLAGRKWPNQFVIGILTGGAATCASPREPDYFGMLGETYRRYPRFRRHLQ